MPSRAAHSKSRSGCLRCKQRRVKCNEGQPCRDCHRRNELCSLVTDPIYIASFKKGASASSALGTTSGTSALSESPFSSASPGTPEQQQDLFALFSGHAPHADLNAPHTDWAADLHLMAHWANHTCSTLIASRPDSLNLLKFTGPEVAVEFLPAMHALLGVAALHLAYLRPNERDKYIRMSMRHQQHVTQGFQPALQSITKDNIVAVFLTSSLLSTLCHAQLSQARHSTEHPPTLSDIVSIFFMTRGVRDIIYPAWRWTSNPEIMPLLGPIVHKYTLDDHSIFDLPDDIADRMVLLRKELLDKHTGHYDTSKESCHFALLELEIVIRDLAYMPQMASTGYDSDFRKRRDVDVGVVMKWQTAVSPTFVNLMKRKHMAALIVLAHWVMLTKHLGDVWFLDGWMETAFDLIRNGLDEEDRHWLDWPEAYARFA